MDRARIEELFAPFAAVSVKRMFGGHGVYADGLFFAIEAGGEIYLKADRHSAARFEEAGSRLFVYQGKDRPITISYWSLPDQALEDGDELVRWAKLAVETALRSGPKRQISAAGRRKAPNSAGKDG
ncbi:TfoX/Sxy family protein [Methylocystis sp. SB2]|uniref:TfoX/Sxy family protein n=1 Tax=Methylocystis sp. (strain SB2) TaxID=743836 RepID=UPI0003FF4C02|nr:TfoX/Sxy family protein [Methylocystis sp. SB2]ULO24020.1 TfoX/Sxy family protein [Methylocystis sp. SB2]